VSSEPSGRRIFLSYRRDDTRHIAGRVFDRLASRFGAANIFIDVDSIEPGFDFREAIESAVAACDVLIALMGRMWLASTDEHGRRRIDDPDDLVAIEINAALERQIRVIPVLVDGVTMPRRGDLPDILSPLSGRNAVRLDHETFSTDITSLIVALERAIGRTDPSSNEQAETARGRRVVNDDVSFAYPAETRLWLSDHSNCRLEVRSAAIKFIDEEDSKYSYELSAKDLTGATFARPWHHGQDILIKLKSGRKYEIGLSNEDLRQRVLAAIQRMLASQ
jgi:TIR domain-containing protein